MIDEILDEVRAEMQRAITKYAPFNSAHEGFAVLLEEVDELKAEVWKKKSNRDKEKMREEAIQIATMAVRFIMDVVDKDADPEY